MKVTVVGVLEGDTVTDAVVAAIAIASATIGDWWCCTLVLVWPLLLCAVLLPTCHVCMVNRA